MTKELNKLPKVKQVNFKKLHLYVKHFAIAQNKVAGIHGSTPQQLNRALRTGKDKSLLSRSLPTFIKRINKKSGMNLTIEDFLN